MQSLVVASIVVLLSAAWGRAASIAITEVNPTGSSAAGYAADWFELTNRGATVATVTGWKFDDSSNSFASAVALLGVTNINPGQSAIFIEGDTVTAANFVTAWFPGGAPPGFLIGFYSGSGVGLASGGDAVNIFDAGGATLAGVTFGAATLGTTFDNAAGLSGAISQLSSVGVNGAFAANGEIGSPGIAPVPEPATVTGFGLAALAGAWAVRRRLGSA